MSLSCSEVKDYKLTEDDIINWLLEGDIHFIISHIHQGIVNINMNKLYASIMKLHDHPGFPVGESLQSPVFTQDKYKYMSILMSKGLCNPTLKVDFLPIMDYAMEVVPKSFRSPMDACFFPTSNLLVKRYFHKRNRRWNYGQCLYKTQQFYIYC